jgi:hypothetical protein
LREVLTLLARTPGQRVFHGPQGGVLKADTLRIVLLREVLKPLAEDADAETSLENMSRLSEMMEKSKTAAIADLTEVGPHADGES